MAEKSAKRKSKKAAKSEDGVLATLSATRPTRLGGERRATTRRATAKTTRQPARTTAAKTPAQKRSATRTSAPKATDAKAATLRKGASAPPAGWQAPDDTSRRKSGPPRGTEIATTAVQAAGELAQIGVTLGGQLLKRAAGRIPRR
jgi:hypothetical protein